MLHGLCYISYYKEAFISTHNEVSFQNLLMMSQTGYQEFHIIRKRGKESILSTFPSKNFLIINPLSKVFAEMLSSRVNHEFLISRHYFSPYNRLIISSSLITNRLTASFFFKILFLDVACSIALRFCSVSAYAYTSVVPS